jgi:hypothetical protein
VVSAEKGGWAADVSSNGGLGAGRAALPDSEKNSGPKNDAADGPPRHLVAGEGAAAEEATEEADDAW